jgi:hypothetical protein
MEASPPEILISVRVATVRLWYWFPERRVLSLPLCPLASQPFPEQIQDHGPETQTVRVGDHFFENTKLQMQKKALEIRKITQITKVEHSSLFLLSSLDIESETLNIALHLDYNLSLFTTTSSNSQHCRRHLNKHSGSFQKTYLLSLPCFAAAEAS